jgi:hypothetical protein
MQTKAVRELTEKLALELLERGVAMPIRPEMRWFYPIDWPQISRQVRFERARGVCENCSNPTLTRIGNSITREQRTAADPETG